MIQNEALEVSEVLENNIHFVLNNFPQNPLIGQVVCCTSEQKLYMYTGNNWAEVYSKSYKTSEGILNGVQIIDTQIINGRTTYIYEAIIFNFPEDIKNAEILVKNTYFCTSTTYKTIIKEVNDSSIIFCLSEFISPDIYDFVIYYDSII